jgi:hypothetical protein
MTYHTINSQSDIDLFLDRTNSLHDAYLIGVDYVHNGISGGNPCYFDVDKAELRLRWLVTSIYDKTVELVFTAPLEWQLKEWGYDITNTAVSLTDKGFVIWADLDSTAPEFREQGSYVIATSMKWRFL